MQVPLPPLDEQRRIAQVLDAADALRAKRLRAGERAARLTESILVDMFGPARNNAHGWDTRTVKDVATVQGGLQVTSKRARHEITVPYLRVANVFRNRVDLSEVKEIRVTRDELGRCALQQDDLLVVEGHGNPQEIGRAARWDGSIEDCVHQNHLIRVRFNTTHVLPAYASVYLNSTAGRRHLLRAGRTTSGLNTINVSAVRKAPLVVPPLERQAEFVERAAAVGQVCARSETHLHHLDALFASLQHRAFAGEL
jgi:type I restriction enzyme S subunit